MVTNLILVRHGQTEWNRIERFRGQYDVELNSNGLEQAKKTANKIASNWKPELVYSSPLSRAKVTAETIALKFGLPVETNLGLIDINYGKWQGLSPEEVKEKWSDQINNWYKHPEMCKIPDGESIISVRDRAMRVIYSITQKHQGRTIVVVSHTVVNRIILLNMLGLGLERFWRLRQEPCAINTIEVIDDEFTLVKMNDTCHLE